MPMKWLVLAGSLTVPVLGWSQEANPAFANPATPAFETGKPSADVANASDQVFLREAALGNRAELDAAKLAGQRGKADSVKKFADRMSADHGDALRKIQDLARATSTPLPKDLDMDHKVVMDQLQKRNAESFDVGYINAQIVDHQRAARLLEYQIGNGQSDRVRDFATATLPAVLQHLAMARQIHAELTGAAP
jgi:putative membrane protein